MANVRYSFSVLVFGLGLALGGCGDGPATSPEQPSTPQFQLAFSGSWTDYFGGGPPVGAAVGPDHRFYLSVDAVVHRAIPTDFLFSYSPEGELVSAWGFYMRSGGLAVDALGNVVVTATDKRNVIRFNPQNLEIARWGSEFQNPADLEVDSRGQVYVADTGNNRIQKFTPEGFFISTWGRPGTGQGEFDSPRGIAIDESDEVYVWDTGNNRVQVFDDSGGFLRMWAAADAEGVLEPWPNGLVGIDAGGKGSIYLVDSGRNRVVEFDRNGTAVTWWGGGGSEPGYFDGPRDIAVDPEEGIYVVDVNNKRIQKFSTGH